MMGRGKLENALINAARIGNITKGKIIIDGRAIEALIDHGMHEQRFQLGSEDDIPAADDTIVKRLLSQAVAREKENVAVAVVQREGEHAAKSLDAIAAPLLPGMDDHLGVAPCAEAVAGTLEFRNQLLEIVDFAVENDCDRMVLVEHRLLAMGDVDNGEPAVTKADAAIDVESRSVRPAMGKGIGHPHQQRAVDRAGGAEIENAGNAAHAMNRSVSYEAGAQLFTIINGSRAA